MANKKNPAIDTSLIKSAFDPIFYEKRKLNPENNFDNDIIVLDYCH